VLTPQEKKSILELRKKKRKNLNRKEKNGVEDPEKKGKKGEHQTEKPVAVIKTGQEDERNSSNASIQKKLRGTSRNQIDTT